MSKGCMRRSWLQLLPGDSIGFAYPFLRCGLMIFSRRLVIIIISSWQVKDKIFFFFFFFFLVFIDSQQRNQIK